jgi:hypothetical protein
MYLLIVYPSSLRVMEKSGLEGCGGRGVVATWHVVDTSVSENSCPFPRPVHVHLKRA